VRTLSERLAAGYERGIGAGVDRVRHFTLDTLPETSLPVLHDAFDVAAGRLIDVAAFVLETGRQLGRGLRTALPAPLDSPRDVLRSIETTLTAGSTVGRELLVRIAELEGLLGDALQTLDAQRAETARLVTERGSLEERHRTVEYAAAEAQVTIGRLRDEIERREIEREEIVAAHRRTLDATDAAQRRALAEAEAGRVRDLDAANAAHHVALEALRNAHAEALARADAAVETDRQSGREALARMRSLLEACEAEKTRLAAELAAAEREESRLRTLLESSKSVQARLIDGLTAAESERARLREDRDRVLAALDIRGADPAVVIRTLNEKALALEQLLRLAASQPSEQDRQRAEQQAEIDALRRQLIRDEELLQSAQRQLAAAAQRARGHATKRSSAPR
jgi:hypothetical protein